MIVQVTAENEALLTRFFNEHPHPQLAKIECRRRAYGLGYGFCRFFLCLSGNEVTAAASLFGNTVLLFTVGGDLSELGQWLGMLPAASVSVNAAGRELLDFPRTGLILFCESQEPLPPPPEGRLDDAFSILRQAFGEEQYSDETYSEWYCEMSHNLRHGVSRLFVEESATATALCVTERLVVLNQIAVLPSGQGRGTGRAFVRRVAAQFPGRRVYVYSRNSGTDAFYRRVGFHEFENWIEG